jgi:hypothetical protein
MRFFPKILNPCKIQTRFKFDLFLNFIIQNIERFGSCPQKESLFHLESSMTMPCLENFEQQEDHVLYFQVFEVFGKALDYLEKSLKQYWARRTSSSAAQLAMVWPSA